MLPLVRYPPPRMPEEAPSGIPGSIPLESEMQPEYSSTFSGSLFRSQTSYRRSLPLRIPAPDKCLHYGILLCPDIQGSVLQSVSLKVAPNPLWSAPVLPEEAPKIQHRLYTECPSPPP